MPTQIPEKNFAGRSRLEIVVRMAARAGVTVAGVLLFALFVVLPATERFAPRDPAGIHVNGREGPSQSGWTVCVFNRDSSGSVPFFSTGGGAFRRIAGQRVFTHRINARSPAEAAALLTRLRAQAEAAGATVRSITVLDHAGPAAPMLGGARLETAFFAEIARFRRPDAEQHLVFMGCEVGKGATGAAFVQGVANDTGMTVVAATQKADSWWGLESAQVVLDSGSPIVVSPAVEVEAFSGESG